MTEATIAQQVEGAKKAAEAKKQGSAGRNGKARRKSPRKIPFKVDDAGVYRCVERENEDGTTSANWVRFCSELHVQALTRNEDGQDWGRLLEVVDRDGNRHLWPMPLSLTAGSGEGLRAELLGLGMELDPKRDAKAWLLEYLISAEPDRRAKCVDRIGWHDGVYVLPDGPLGESAGKEQVILQGNERSDHAFNVGGTLESWQATVALPALGNSRLMLATSAAFAAPLLALMDDEGGGFHFRGASSSGKSTALTVAGSVWGGGGTRGFVRQWRATDNALESVASLCCDNLLCLDELSQVDAKAAASAAYMLSNGRGKARAGREGQARKVLEWRVLFLSNGEIGLADKIREGGGRIAAGMEVRVVDLRADAGAGMGIFEDIHNAADPASFAREMKRAANASYGLAGRAFVGDVANDLVRYREELAALRKSFTERVLPLGADGQVRRVADRFALAAAAGEMASGLGLTGWPQCAAMDAAQRCFNDWMRERGGIGSSEVADARKRIIEALESYGASRFMKWHRNADRAVITPRIGFVKIEGDDNAEDPVHKFFLMASALREILAGLDFSTVISGLMEEGFIVSQNGKPNKTFHVPNAGEKHRLYEIARGALGGDDD